MQARLGCPVAPNRVMAEYRTLLFDSGRAREAGRNGERGRAGFSREEIQAVLAKGGELDLLDALRCRVRYFCDGALFGSRAFVEGFFESHRKHFGATRQSGARRLAGIRAGDLFVARALQLEAIG